MKEKTYKIYCHINKKNGKRYVGQTCKKPEERWQQGNGYAKCPLFYKAIKKYGWDCFEHIILEENLTLEKANELEEYYISTYKSNNPIYGYNILAGGNNRELPDSVKKKLSEISKNRPKKKQSEETRLKRSESLKRYYQTHKPKNYGIPMKEETKQKQRESHLGEKNFWYGKHLSKEAREKMSIAGKKKWERKGYREHMSEVLSESVKGENNPFYGKKHSKETRTKMSEKKIGHKPTRGNKGMKWFNNGEKQLCAFECPEGYVRGMLKRGGDVL